MANVGVNVTKNLTRTLLPDIGTFPNVYRRTEHNGTTKGAISMTITCACGTEVIIEFDTMMSDGQRTVMLSGNTQSVQHCDKGTPVIVPGKLTAFYEIVDGKLIAVRPIVSDPLED